MTGRLTLGDLIRRRMKEYEYTVEALAEEIGMTPGGLYRLLGGSIPRIGEAKKYRLCLALDIAPRVLEEVIPCRTA